MVLEIILILKKFWKWIAGGAFVLFAFLGKKMYDKSLRQEGRSEIVEQVKEESSQTVQEFYEKQDEVKGALDPLVNAVPKSWAGGVRKPKGNNPRQKPPKNRSRRRM